MRTRRHFLTLLGLGLATTGLAVGSTLAPSVAQGGGGGSSATGDRAPIFDFTDAYYRANGVDPAQLVGRRSGNDGLSVATRSPDSSHRDVRTTFTLPAYDTSGKRWYFTVLADLAPQPFTADASGADAQRVADASPVYVFPTRTGNPTSVGNNRQADMVDLSGGYFSNNPLGLWVHVFVTWTPAAFDTPKGTKALTALAKKNGLALDDTPIIKTRSDLDSLTKAGYVVQTRRATTETGRYFVCPVFKDPRRGAIAPDAFLATVRRADGTPLPAEQAFVSDFESLRSSGDYPKS